MRTVSLFIASLLVLSGAACRHEPVAGPAATRVDATGEVVVRRVAGGVALTNGTNRPIAYAVWNRGWLALFGPCTDPGPGCARLPAGASVTVPDRSVEGYDAGMREVVVRWWHVVPDDASGGYRAEDLHEVVVTL